MKFTSLENLQYFLSKLSYVSKESGILNSIITSYLNNFKRDVVQIVSTLPNPGETGVLYLVPQGGNRFIEYYYNNNEYIQVGSSVFDSAVDAQLSNASKNPVQNKVILNALDTKLNASQLVNALNNTSSETPQSQVIYNLLNGKTSSEDFLSITNLDINSLFIDSLLEAGKLVCTGSTTWIIDDDGNLYGCGYNSNGQQGSGDTSNVLTFTKRAENVKSVQAISTATFYLTNDDELYTAGMNVAGKYDTTTFILKKTNVDSYNITNNNFWVLTKDGELYGAGANFYGQLGSGKNGKGTDDWILRKRAENVKSFFSGGSTTWYIDNNNDLYGCGNNNYNQQGLDVPVKDKNQHYPPYAIVAADTYPYFQKRASNVKTVIATANYTLYIDFDGNLYGCGRNDNGQLGSTSSGVGFIKIAENVKTCACSGNYNETTWYLTEDGDLYGTGDNAYGQQGSGNTSTVKKFTKRAENVKDFKCSNYVTWYLSENGDLYGTGNNYHGNQGSGDETNVLTFTKRADNVRDFKCDSAETWFLTKNGDLYGAGDGSWGNQGAGSGSASRILTFTERAENVENFNFTAYTTFYVSDGNLYGCGRNNYGQLGMGDTTDRTTFTKTTY